MRWIALILVTFIAGCNLVGGGLTGHWRHPGGLEVDLASNRTWTGNYPTSFGALDLSGQWTSDGKTVRLVPLTWKKRISFPGMSASNSQEGFITQEANRALATLQSKNFRLDEKSAPRRLIDADPLSNLTLTAVE